jgi:hypothetical protein
MQFFKVLFSLTAVSVIASASAFAYDPETDACLVEAKKMAMEEVYAETKVPGHNTDLDRLAYFSATYYGKTIHYNPHDYAEPLDDGKHVIEVAMDCPSSWAYGCHGYAKHYVVASYQSSWIGGDTCTVVAR